MASIITNRITSVVSAAAGTSLTISSTTGLYVGMYGTLRGPLGVPEGTRVRIVEVVSATVIRCILAPETGFVVQNERAEDLSAYATGNIYFEPQVAMVYNVVT